ncbi:hypothetical protein HFX_2256 [Haloferax mediterranei ATCC 33500]|uniref:Uncharacterized protein n=1 Tax=Haloferax mediterranei (strain ATCC 33500 / DSM 1411 / JCM 8866 / NBRC 14739 / NCIMB 2177 / R-4) TaxID=523841 RepID=I3R6T4_HALMT|nr:hypothetical protein HFX_2256 [Haloferax mediterranei ATCC 33500]
MEPSRSGHPRTILSTNHYHILSATETYESRGISRAAEETAALGAPKKHPIDAEEHPLDAEPIRNPFSEAGVDERDGDAKCDDHAKHAIEGEHRRDRKQQSQHEVFGRTVIADDILRLEPSLRRVDVDRAVGRAVPRAEFVARAEPV